MAAKSRLIVDAEQSVAIAALLETGSLKKAAEMANVSVNTMSEWLANPHFANALKQEANRVKRTSINRMQLAMSKATDTLIANMECGNPAVEVRAALGLVQTLQNPHINDEEIEEARKFMNAVRRAVERLDDNAKRIFKEELLREQNMGKPATWVYGEDGAVVPEDTTG